MLRAAEGHASMVLAPSGRAPGAGDPPLRALVLPSSCQQALLALLPCMPGFEDASSNGGPEDASPSLPPGWSSPAEAKSSFF